LVSRHPQWELGGCAAAELAWMTVEGITTGLESTGTGPAPNVTAVGPTRQSSDVTWFVLRPEVTVVYRWTRFWAFRAEAGVGIGIGTPSFVWLGPGGGLLHRPADVTARAALGVELRF
jgi:hypothetical protein